MIEVSHLTKSYGSRQAVTDLTFSLQKGKVYGLLGQNGAGKSTTMNLMTGYLSPDKGSITVCGIDLIKDPVSAKKHIGYLPEIPPLYPEMTVNEYLSFVAELKQIPKKESRDTLAKVLKMTGTGGVSNRLIRHLSKGYKQRVGMAQALIGFPEVIILDEPTVGLDPQQMKEVRELIAELGKDHTVILSSHILSEIGAVCDELLMIANGKIVAQGTPAELTKKAGGDGSLTVRIAQTDKEDIGDKVTEALKAAGITDIEITTGEKSLEEIFLEVTGS